MKVLTFNPFTAVTVVWWFEVMILGEIINISNNGNAKRC